MKRTTTLAVIGVLRLSNCGGDESISMGNGRDTGVDAGDYVTVDTQPSDVSTDDSDLPQSSSPDRLEIECRLSPDWSWRAQSNCTMGVEPGDLFDIEKSVYDACCVEFCQGEECDPSTGDRVNGITFDPVVPVHDFEVEGEAYSMTNYAPAMDETCPFLSEVLSEGRRDIEVKIILTTP